MKPGALLLFPGAGSDRDHSSLRALDDAVGPRLAVERADFPYRKAGQEGARPATGAARVACATEAAALVARARVRAGPPRARWSIDGWADVLDGGRRRASRPPASC